MNPKANKIAIGIILLLAGIFVLFEKNQVYVSTVLYSALGVSLILLYLTKRKSWSLAIGGYALWFGLSNFLKEYVLKGTFLNFSFASLYIVTAIIFLVLYFDKNKKELLLPGAILFWFGVYTLFKDIPYIPIRNNGFSLFLLCFGLAFFTTYLISKRGKGFLYLGILLSFVSVLVFFNSFPIIAGVSNLVVGLVLIIASLTVIIKTNSKGE